MLKWFHGEEDKQGKRAGACTPNWRSWVWCGGPASAGACQGQREVRAASSRVCTGIAKLTLFQQELNVILQL